MMLSNQWWNVPSKLTWKEGCALWLLLPGKTYIQHHPHYFALCIIQWLAISMHSIIFFYSGIMHGHLLSLGQRSTMKWIKGLPTLNELETSSINSHSCQDQVDNSIYTSLNSNTDVIMLPSFQTPKFVRMVLWLVSMLQKLFGTMRWKVRYEGITIWASDLLRRLIVKPSWIWWIRRGLPLPIHIPTAQRSAKSEVIDIGLTILHLTNQ